VTPSFLADEPNALAFSLPVGKTFAERHHIRFWTTTIQTPTGQSLWLATASFDQGFELAPSTGLPTHQIAPDIDTERTFVVTSLEGTGLVISSQTIQLVPPEAGRNFKGDPFHTDGKAVILQLSAAAARANRLIAGEYPTPLSAMLAVRTPLVSPLGILVALRAMRHRGSISAEVVPTHVLRYRRWGRDQIRALPAIQLASPIPTAEARHEMNRRGMQTW
jgi:hypothetical protein